MSFSYPTTLAIAPFHGCKVSKLKWCFPLTIHCGFLHVQSKCTHFSSDGNIALKKSQLLGRQSRISYGDLSKETPNLDHGNLVVDLLLHFFILSKYQIFSREKSKQNTSSKMVEMSNKSQMLWTNVIFVSFTIIELDVVSFML